MATRETEEDTHATVLAGTIVTLCALEARPDLNGETAMLTSKVHANARREAFVLPAGDRVKRPEGINVKPQNFTVNTVERRGRASAWNELGSRFVNSQNYMNALDAFECALDVASKNPEECRVEGCDALSLMTWLALRMNKEGVEFQGKRRTTDIVNAALRNIFAEVLHGVDETTSKVQMGAGRIPSRPNPVLLLCIRDGVEDASAPARYYFYDEVQKMVHECVTDKKNTTPETDDDGGGGGDRDDGGTLGVAAAAPEGQAEVLPQT